MFMHFPFLNVHYGKSPKHVITGFQVMNTLRTYIDVHRALFHDERAVSTVPQTNPQPDTCVDETSRFQAVVFFGVNQRFCPMFLR